MKLQVIRLKQLSYVEITGTGSALVGEKGLWQIVLIVFINTPSWCKSIPTKKKIMKTRQC